ncbi:MAG: hypothetical protein M1165_01575 [Candidatus Pacearchaeota archaeon]|nr:hypothetical protein [Candidatus Pacearchaeota archaeon]MDE1848657.1 hypothetical protein [Nanoarchaeota archaeon]
MNKRGVSPVIATVLLIGIVIALGLVVFLWFRGFTQEAITKFSGENIQLVCGDVQFSANYQSGQLALQNAGNVPIYSFSIQMNSAGGSYSTGDITTLTGNWPKTGLRSGGTFGGALNFPSGTTVTSLLVVPILRGSLSNGQEQSYTCTSQGQTVSVSGS